MKKVKRLINNINLDGVSVGTVTRFVMVLISIFVFVAESFDIVPATIDENAVFNIVVVVFGIVSFLQSYWKNNSWTKAAQDADKYIHEQKGCDEE